MFLKVCGLNVPQADTRTDEVFKDFELTKLYTPSLDELRETFPAITLLGELSPCAQFFPFNSLPSR